MSGRKALELTGQRFGRLVAVCRIENSPHGYAMWRTLCDCGKTHNVAAAHLNGGKTKSCGCLNVDLLVERSSTHRASKTPEYNIWNLMIRRCYDQESSGYQNYGARGITICDRWRESFPTFLADMGPRPARGMSIDRVDNNGPYSPENCRWATAKQQGANKRTTIRLELNGETDTLTEWSKRAGVARETLKRRLRGGFTMEQAMTTVLPRTEYAPRDALGKFSKEPE